MLLPGEPRVVQALGHSCPVPAFSSVVPCSHVKDKRQRSSKGLEEKYVLPGLSVALQGKVVFVWCEGLLSVLRSSSHFVVRRSL